MFLAGEDRHATSTRAKLVRDAGFEPVDIGG
jgi:predicted dinucleotide-binding enzyme